MRLSPLRGIYLVLALCGAALPLVTGPTVPARADMAAGPFWTLALAIVALSVWIIAETRVRRNWIALVAIPATLLIGIGCGLPLYLFLRTRPVS